MDSRLGSKIRILASLNASIRQIQIRLRSLCAERDQIEQEIGSIRASNPPIKRLPLELLSHVFFLLVQPDFLQQDSFESVPREIASLLLVCKSWHNTTINTPALWSFVHAIVPSSGAAKARFDVVDRQKKLIDICLIRSKQAPLSVFIDFETMIDYRQLAYNDAWDAMEGLLEMDELEEWLGEIPWRACPLPEAYRSRCEALICAIVGAEGEHMARWKSLYLHISRDGKIAREIWKFFNHSAPQLSELRIFGSLGFDRPSDGLSVPLNSLPLLQEIAIFSPAYLEILESCPFLRRIELWLGSSAYLLFKLEIHRYPALKELLIHIEDPDSRADDSIFDPIMIPELDCLDLSGPFPPKFIQALVVPKVTQLEISESRRMTSYSCSVSAASLYSVVEHLVYSPATRPKDEHFADLCSLLPQLTKAHTIEIHRSILEVTNQAVERSRALGHLQFLLEILPYTIETREIYSYKVYDPPVIID